MNARTAQPGNPREPGLLEIVEGSTSGKRKPDFSMMSTSRWRGRVKTGL